MFEATAGEMAVKPAKAIRADFRRMRGNKERLMVTPVRYSDSVCMLLRPFGLIWFVKKGRYFRDGMYADIRLWTMLEIIQHGTFQSCLPRFLFCNKK
jgi:hypothetical protein